jgi:hypothetical protein
MRVSEGETDHNNFDFLLCATIVVGLALASSFLL